MMDPPFLIKLARQEDEDFEPRELPPEYAEMLEELRCLGEEYVNNAYDVRTRNKEIVRTYRRWYRGCDDDVVPTVLRETEKYLRILRRDVSKQVEAAQVDEEMVGSDDSDPEYDNESSEEEYVPPQFVPREEYYSLQQDQYKLERDYENLSKEKKAIRRELKAANKELETMALRNTALEEEVEHLKAQLAQAQASGEEPPVHEEPPSGDVAMEGVQEPPVEEPSPFHEPPTSRQRSLSPGLRRSERLKRKRSQSPVGTSTPQAPRSKRSRVQSSAGAKPSKGAGGRKPNSSKCKRGNHGANWGQKYNIARLEEPRAPSEQAPLFDEEELGLVVLEAHPEVESFPVYYSRLGMEELPDVPIPIVERPMTRLFLKKAKDMKRQQRR